MWIVIRLLRKLLNRRNYVRQEMAGFLAEIQRKNPLLQHQIHMESLLGLNFGGKIKLRMSS